MPVRRRLIECIQDAALDAEIRICHDSYLRRDLVCHLKTDARNIVRQLIRIVLENRVHCRTVFLVDFNRQIDGNAIILQKHHRLAHIALFLDLFTDGHRHFFTDSLDLREAFRLFFHDAECIRLKFFNYPGS